jgi:hypothetical protein
MTGILKVDTIQNSTGTVSIPVEFMRKRLIQRTQKTFKLGTWNPGNTYYTIPGSTIGLTPVYDHSFIRYVLRMPITYPNGGNQHEISHWIFYAEGRWGNREYARFCRSKDHLEDAFSQEWWISSWGAGKATTMGYIMRNYASGSNYIATNASCWWNGTASFRAQQSWVMAEEWLPGLAEATYILTNTGNNYRVAGWNIDPTENNPGFKLIRGSTYNFINNAGVSLPFQFRTGSVSGPAFTTGVTGNPQISLIFTVPYTAPDILYYSSTTVSTASGIIRIYD